MNAEELAACREAQDQFESYTDWETIDSETRYCWFFKAALAYRQPEIDALKAEVARLQGIIEGMLRSEPNRTQLEKARL